MVACGSQAGGQPRDPLRNETYRTPDEVVAALRRRPGSSAPIGWAILLLRAAPATARDRTVHACPDCGSCSPWRADGAPQTRCTERLTCSTTAPRVSPSPAS